MFNIECGEYVHFKGKPYIVYGTGVLEGSEEYVIYRHDYGTREFWIRPTEMFKETIERDGKVMQRFRLTAKVSDEESLKALADVFAGGVFPLYHSETLLAYEIAELDAKNGVIKLVKSDKFSKKEF